MVKLGAEEGIIFAKHFAAVLAFSLLGWLVSWWNLSLVGVLFICALYSWKVTFEDTRKLHLQQSKSFFSSEKKAIQDIFEDIPRWVRCIVLLQVLCICKLICVLSYMIHSTLYLYLSILYM